MNSLLLTTSRVDYILHPVAPRAHPPCPSPSSEAAIRHSTKLVDNLVFEYMNEREAGVAFQLKHTIRRSGICAGPRVRAAEGFLRKMGKRRDEMLRARVAEMRGSGEAGADNGGEKG